MADLAAISAQLDRLHQELIASRVFVAGRPDSGAKAAEESSRLERVAENLRIIVRDLNSSESMLRVRESQLRSTPPHQRYSTEQSLRQLTENVQAVRSKAQKLADLVRELLDRNGLLNPIQKAKGILDLASDLDKVVGQEAQAQVAQLLHASRQTILSTPSVGGPIPSVSGVVGLVAFAYLGIKLLQKKSGSKP
ncbi:hypothetical protein [uncultured Paludibaculum sp.]|uniref:hypothetical protein n=1 Tax=uncultured Paludibaculum sp. TaxID=1765020 RepID=UPI002AABA340|nr:hypothetical protein [uncultured Paludibaculum sp.]